MAALLSLPKDVQSLVFSLIPENEIPCSLRLVNKDFAAGLSSPEHKTVRLSMPVPFHAFIWRWRPHSSYLRILNLKSRLKLLALTAASGVLLNLEVAFQPVSLYFGASCTYRDVEEAAATAGHLHICRWLRQQGWDWRTALRAAARAGHRPICEWLHEHYGDDILFEQCFLESALEAAQGGHVALVEWFVQRAGVKFEKQHLGDILASAAQGCDLPTLQRFHRSWRAPPRDAIKFAACSPTPDWRAKVEWLETLGLPRSQDCGAAVAGLPDAVDRLRWLQQRGYPVGEGAGRAAVRAGNIPALEYLLGEAAVRPSTDGFVKEAIEVGNLEVLQLLLSRDCPVDHSSAAVTAVANGHLAVVAWLAETLGVDVAQLGPELMDAAAKCGSVELLRWLYERGCRCGDKALEGAAAGGCEAALEWLVEVGCRWPESCVPYSCAARNGDLAMMRCLRRLGCPWGQSPETGGPSELFTECMTAGVPSTVLHWLVAEGCPLDWAAVQRGLGR